MPTQTIPPQLLVNVGPKDCVQNFSGLVPGTATSAMSSAQLPSGFMPTPPPTSTLSPPQPSSNLLAAAAAQELQRQQVNAMMQQQQEQAQQQQQRQQQQQLQQQQQQLMWSMAQQPCHAPPLPEEAQQVDRLYTQQLLSQTYANAQNVQQQLLQTLVVEQAQQRTLQAQLLEQLRSAELPAEFKSQATARSMQCSLSGESVSFLLVELGKVHHQLQQIHAMQQQSAVQALPQAGVKHQLPPASGSTSTTGRKSQSSPKKAPAAPGSRVFRCAVCNRMFSSIKGVNGHMRSHSTSNKIRLLQQTAMSQADRLPVATSVPAMPPTQEEDKYTPTSSLSSSDEDKCESVAQEVGSKRKLSVASD